MLNARSLEPEKPEFECPPALLLPMYNCGLVTHPLSLHFLFCKVGTRKFSGQRVAVQIK